MPDTIELVKPKDGFSTGPLGSNITLYIGESAVKYPNILMKTASEVPKVLISEGAKKNIKATVHINRTSSSTLSEERSKDLANQIARQMIKEGFNQCNFKLNFISSSPKVLFEGKPIQMMLGAKAYTAIPGTNATPASSQSKNLLGHELTHVVQQ